MTFITRKHLSRRTVLRGAGIALALPLLDAMVPAATALADTAAAAKPRLGFIYFPHGAIMEKWTPATTDADFALSPILEPLAPYRDYLTVVSNIGNKPAESRAVHALVPATWLSCVHPQESWRRAWRRPWTRSPPSTSARTHRTPRLRSRPPRDTAWAAPASAATVAAIPARCRSRRPRRPCRSRATRDNCSCGCSVRVTRPKSGVSSASRPPASWT